MALELSLKGFLADIGLDALLGLHLLPSDMLGLEHLH